MSGTATERTALVIEDDEQIAQLLRFILEREGFRVEHAGDGRAAEALIDRLAPPQIVTLDVMMPYSDGYQVLGRIRSREGWSKVPVILLTARSQEKDVVRGLGAGANDYLVKPFRPEELRARVRRLAQG